MGQYKVIIFPTARQDLQGLVDVLNTLSPAVALSTYDAIVQEITSLAEFPFRCPKLKDLALAARGYRSLLVKNYLVFYVVRENTVQIRRILYAKSDYLSLLGDKFTT